MFLRNIYYLKNNDQEWVNRYTIKSEFIAKYKIHEKKRSISDNINETTMGVPHLLVEM